MLKLCFKNKASPTDTSKGRRDVVRRAGMAGDNNKKDNSKMYLLASQLY